MPKQNFASMLVNNATTLAFSVNSVRTRKIVFNPKQKYEDLRFDLCEALAIFFDTLDVEPLTNALKSVKYSRCSFRKHIKTDYYDIVSERGLQIYCKIYFVNNKQDLTLEFVSRKNGVYTSCNSIERKVPKHTIFEQFAPLAFTITDEYPSW